MLVYLSKKVRSGMGGGSCLEMAPDPVATLSSSSVTAYINAPRNFDPGHTHTIFLVLYRPFSLQY